MPAPSRSRRPRRAASTRACWTAADSPSRVSSMPSSRNAALHWMRDPDAVIAGVWRALRSPAGVLSPNAAARAMSPMSSALAGGVGAARHRRQAGRSRGISRRPRNIAPSSKRGDSSVPRSRLFPRPTQLPGRLGDWLDTFAESFLALVPETRASVQGRGRGRAARRCSSRTDSGRSITCGCALPR